MKTLSAFFFLENGACLTFTFPTVEEMNEALNLNSSEIGEAKMENLRQK